MNTLTHNDNSLARLQVLTDISQQLLDKARALGATAAEVGCSESFGLSVNVRMGEVETVESTRDRGIGVTVYFGHRKGNASTADMSPASLQATVEQACAIARYTEDDLASGLADAELMATHFPDLDLWHPHALDADTAVDLALACEAAGRDSNPLITNSDGAGIGGGESVSVYANSHGFVGADRGTHFSLSCALIAGEDDAMQRNGWYSSGLAFSDLDSPESIGKEAAKRTVASLNPRSVATGQYPVLFETSVARSLIGHFTQAISGGALYRRSSFLLDSLGTQLFPEWFSIDERPLLVRGLRSSAFDSEGIATREASLIEQGILQHYVLGSYSARKLGLVSTANAGGLRNLFIKPNAGGFDSLVSTLHTGLLITQLMGQGVNPVTGDYSRGASGFWVENGEIAYPVDGITVAGNLKTMLRDIQAVGNDFDKRSHIQMGSVLIGSMTVAGE